MSTILYSMAGEGRGHATRARTVIEELRGRHDIIVYAPGQAYDLLEPLYRSTEISVRRIPGLFWHYDSNRRLNYVTSAVGALTYLSEMPIILRRLAREIERERADLVISDFDPALPRAANAVGVPFISFDHQHFIVAYDLGSLPLRLRMRAAFMAPAVRMFYGGHRDMIISSFYFPPLRQGYEKVKQIGVLLSKEIIRSQRTEGKHLTVYIRKFSSPRLLEALKKCGCEVRIYGLGKRPSEGRLRFFNVNIHRFVDDLATSRGLICTAGNQVVGEALYLQKPVFAIPEAGNFEQEINGYFVRESGAGMSEDLDKVDTPSVRRFLDQGDYFRSNIVPERLNGNVDAVRIIEGHLQALDSGVTLPEEERAVS